MVRKPLEKGLPQPPRFVVDYRGLNTVTAANVLFHEVFLQLGFPSVLQSDQGGEFLNALLHRITQLLSIKQVFTSGFRPRLNGATERSHRFLNSALGIFCEHQQEKWEQFLQPAVYSHNVSPISGTTNITPFFLVFGRDAPSPETISFDLPVNPLPPDHYARHLLSRMKVAHQQFSQVKSDLRRHQKEVYDRKARFLAIPPGKIVYVRKEPQTHKPGMATRFLRSFDGPFQVIGHPYDRNDLLTLKNLSTGAVIPRPVNIENVLLSLSRKRLTFSLLMTLSLNLNLRLNHQHLCLLLLMLTQNYVRLPMSLGNIWHLSQTKRPLLLKHVNKFTSAIHLLGKF